MTNVTCVRWQGELAMQALGKLERDLAVGLQAHLDGCPACRGHSVELAEVAGALTFASPGGVEEAEPARLSAHLQESVLGRLDEEVARGRHRRRLRIGVLATAATAIAAAAAIALPSASPVPTGRVVTLRGAVGTSASITLHPSSSGTDVTLVEHGQPAGQDYEVSMQSSSGRWWQAGSYHTSGSVARAQLSCAVESYEITRVWVRDANGASVLMGFVH